MTQEPNTKGFANAGLLMLAIVVCLALAFTPGCGPGKSDGPVASINGRKVTRDEFKSQAAFLGLGSDPARLTPEMRGRVLEALIRDELVVQRAGKLGISLETEVLHREEASMRKGLAADAFQRSLATQGIAYQQWLGMLARQLLVKKTLDLVLGSKIAIPIDQVRRYYQAHLEEFRQPAQILAQHVVLPDRGLAVELLRRVKEGENLAAVAAEMDVPLEEGGQPVWLSSGHMPPALEKKIFALKPGKLAGPLASDYGFHVVRVLDKRKPMHTSLAQAAELIQQRLSAREMEKLAEDWLEQLRKDANIWINKDFLAQG